MTNKQQQKLAEYLRKLAKNLLSSEIDNSDYVIGALEGIAEGLEIQVEEEKKDGELKC